MGRPRCGKRPKLPPVDKDLEERLTGFGQVGFCAVLNMRRWLSLPVARVHQKRYLSFSSHLVA